MPSIFNNPNFQLLDKVAGKPTISVTSSGVGFSKQTLSMLGYAHYVQMFINNVDKQLGIKPCNKEDVGALRFVTENRDRIDSLRWNNPTFKENIKSLVDPELANENFTCEGEFIKEENALLFDFKKAVPLRKINGK